MATVRASEEDEMEMDIKEEDDEDEENRGSSSSRFQYQQQLQEQVSTPAGGGARRRSRPLEENERTKLRERHRRASTARILAAGLRRRGNYQNTCNLKIIYPDLHGSSKVVMPFHECGGNVGDDVCIPLPCWVAEIGRSKCLSWGIDKERVLRGRTAVEVYFDYIRSFRVEFDDLFEDGIITMVQVGLGRYRELRYPSCPVKHGLRYPRIGEFQSYDQYMLERLRKAAEMKGHIFWARMLDNAGSYNSHPHETGFFCDGGDYDGYYHYGRFFIDWHSAVLVDHGDRVLSLGKLAFSGTCIAEKLPGIHWWYKKASHAAELTAGFCNPHKQDGYTAIAAMVQEHGAALNFASAEVQFVEQHEELQVALTDPQCLVWQVLKAAWENALFYLRFSSLLIERHNFMEFERFVK
ncbi:hypothetical protein PTKIN_Ptkin12aG0181700 [Pterospermum kingtungense]